MTRAGYNVTPAEDGAQGWEALHTNSYDLLITDNKMPRLTGLELVRKVRLEGMKLSIIMASGSTNVLDDPNCKWPDIEGRLKKPFEPDKLLETVQQVFSTTSNAESGATTFSSELTETLRRITPYQRCGLNE